LIGGCFDTMSVGENVAPQVRGAVIWVCPSGTQSPVNIILP